MRRLSVVSAAVLGCTILACQDGPNQTYTPPPAAAQWNDGRGFPTDGGVPTVPPGTATAVQLPDGGWYSQAPYALPDGGAISSGGNNANEICTQQQIAAINPVLNTAPIVPPNSSANLNLAGVDYIDSSGVGQLVGSFTAVRNAGGELKLLNLTQKVQDVLHVTKLYTVFDIKDDEFTAVKSFDYFFAK